MTGLKYKLAHKRAENERWSATDNSQRKRLIQVLEDLPGQLKNEMFDSAKKRHKGKRDKGIERKPLIILPDIKNILLLFRQGVPSSLRHLLYFASFLYSLQ